MPLLSSAASSAAPNTLWNKGEIRLWPGARHGVQPAEAGDRPEAAEFGLYLGEKCLDFAQANLRQHGVGPQPGGDVRVHGSKAVFSHHDRGFDTSHDARVRVIGRTKTGRLGMDGTAIVRMLAEGAAGSWPISTGA